MAHNQIHITVGNVGIYLIADTVIDQGFKDLVAILKLIEAKELLPFSLHGCSPEEVAQVAVSKCLKIPSITLKIHSIIDGGCSGVRSGKTQVRERVKVPEMLWEMV